jgi:hypothetical protein
MGTRAWDLVRLTLAAAFLREARVAAGGRACGSTPTRGWPQARARRPEDGGARKWAVDQPKPPTRCVENDRL